VEGAVGDTLQQVGVVSKRLDVSPSDLLWMKAEVLVVLKAAKASRIPLEPDGTYRSPLCRGSMKVSGP
jgi:hypothetical protein